MGEAKRRAVAREHTADLAENIIPRLSTALKKLATAASGYIGSDCYIHAAIGREILGRVGVETKIICGYAGFRVGPGDSDVILHAPMPGMPPQPGGVAYHVWLEVGDHILDLTAYQLRAKAASLDALDGGHTNVTWCPDYIYIRKSETRPFGDVMQLHAGLCYYSRQPAVEDFIILHAPAMDAADLEAAWMIYQNPGLVVFGPNDVEGKSR